MSRRIFEQPENNDPDLTKRVAFGGASKITENMTWSNFITWITGKLSFLKISENLNDLDNATTARTNLGVYSTTQVDTLLDDKADELDVLTKTNTTVYTPTADYHPGTKKYIDDQDESYSTVTVTPNTGGTVTAVNLKAYRHGASILIFGTVTIDSTSGAEVQVASISGYSPPTSDDVPYPSAAILSTNENASGRLASDGKIYLRAHQNRVWRINFSAIG